MGIKNLSEDVLLVFLTAEPELDKQLQQLNAVVSQSCEQDLIVDFSKVEVLDSSNLSNLMILNNFVKDSGHKLVLFNMNITTKSLFQTVGLKTEFKIVDDKSSALNEIGKSNPLNDRKH